MLTSGFSTHYYPDHCLLQPPANQDRSSSITTQLAVPAATLSTIQQQQADPQSSVHPFTVTYMVWAINIPYL